jgi:PAS domain-containing protein
LPSCRCIEQPRNTGQVLRYSVANQDWFSLFTPVSVGHQRFWLGVFAPEDEFVPGTTRDRSVLAFIALLSLLAGVFVAIRIGRQFGAPLERLAGEAKRIGRMELDTPVTTDAPWREVRQLAGAQETMRQRLREATHRLDEANAALEATVEERTRELEESRRAALESETFFRAIFDNAAIGISNLAPDLHRLRVNRAFAEFTGYSADELLERAPSSERGWSGMSLQPYAGQLALGYLAGAPTAVAVIERYAQ